MALTHWGIFGMKWGRRRYQNPDGTYTQAGLERKRSSRSKDKKNRKESEKDASRKKRRNAGTDAYSDEELRAAVERLRLEKQYKDLYEELHPKKIGFARTFAAKFGSTLVSGLGTRAAERALSSLFPKKETAQEKASRMEAEDKIRTIRQKWANGGVKAESTEERAKRMEAEEKILDIENRRKERNKQKQ